MTFTASNGTQVEGIEPNGIVDGISLTPKMGRGVTLFEDDMTAVREYFQSRTDTRLGRWRFNDHIVVYPRTPDFETPKRTVDVLDERVPRLYQRWEGSVVEDDEYSDAAVAYFKAHPEPKAWDSAEEGDVWLISTRGGTYPAIFQAQAFTDVAGRWMPDEVQEGRRIWPPVFPDVF